MTPQIVKKVPSLPTEPWKLFGSRGAPRLRLATVLQHRGAFAEAEPLRRRELDAYGRLGGPEHRVTLIAVNNLASVLAPPGEVQRGAADVLRRAVTVAGGWCCILCWEKLGKIAGKQQPHFQIISEFVIYVEVR